ncbi:MAG TPA: NAD(P)H-dependent oxidoreductase [Kofleriaceae bacterium]|jgi:FMN-dependent NADH-azoreductase
MSHLLHVNASPRREDSQSLALASTFLDRYRGRHPGMKVDTLNLFEEELPRFGAVGAAAKFTAFTGNVPTGEQAEIWSQARAVFDRFVAADQYVFNVPMWNAGVPYVLKHWIDVITQPGWVFGFDPVKGYTGLVTGKKAVVIYTSGVYARGVPLMFGDDFQSTFFNDWLRFIGITDVTEIRYDGIAMSADPEGHIRRAKDRAQSVAATF